MKYLVRSVETYRVANEEEAKKTIEEAKEDPSYVLSKYSSEYKCSKSKCEVVDEWFRVQLTKDFNLEKEPASIVDITYSVSNFHTENREENNYETEF